MSESVELPSRLAILPFRNKVLLPGAIIRIRCTSPSSVKLVEQELWQREEKGLIGILPVRDSAESTTSSTLISGMGSDSGDRGSKAQGGIVDHKQNGKNQKEVFQWHNRGVAARALHLSRGVEKPSGRVTYIVVLEGLCRFNVQELSTKGTYYTARIAPLDMTKLEMEQVEQDSDFIALSRQFKATAMELISILEQKQKTGGRTKVLLETVPVHKLADIFVASFEISFEEQLSMLDSVDVKVRLSKATELVDRHLQSIRVAEKITQKVEGQLSKSQKEFLLRQQMRAIQEELGDNDDEDDDVAALERKMQEAEMPANIWKHAQRELRRLKKMQPQQPGYNSSRVYLELLAELPWQRASEELELNLRAVKERLDSDHYGLVKVKQRIVEYLAVRKLKPDARGPVLCFVGPPGVGKTSLASSIAAALGRKFIRISLGGVKDEGQAPPLNGRNPSSKEMYDNLGGHPGGPRPPQQPNLQPNPFENAFYGASPGLIKGGLSAYGEKILGTGSKYVQSNISRWFSDPQYYFQVNDQYVRNKLKVVLFPFLHRGHWTRITEPVGGRLSYKPPIYDINAPDMYIPLMAFGTYVVLAGLSLGLHGKFSPEALNWLFVKGLFGWFIQVSLLKMSLLSLGGAEAPLLDIVAYAGYTFAGLSFAVLGKILLSYSYYFVMPWTCLCMGIFLVKTMKRVLFAEVRTYDSSRHHYLLLFIALAQFPLFIWLGNVSVNWLF